MAKSLKKENMELVELLQEVVDDYDPTGCEDCGVISVEIYKKIYMKLNPGTIVCSRCKKLFHKSDMDKRTGECPECVKGDERCED